MNASKDTAKRNETKQDKTRQDKQSKPNKRDKSEQNEYNVLHDNSERHQSASCEIRYNLAVDLQRLENLLRLYIQIYWNNL